MSAVAILGRAALLPAPAAPLCTDADLGGVDARPVAVRSLSGRLDAAPDGMSRWARLDRYGKAMAAVCDGVTTRAALADGPPSGLYVASLRSCLETNAAFDHGLIDKGPRLASPLLFPYTLPGSTASEAAMLLGLTGPYLVFPGGPAAALGAVVAAADALADREADRLVVAAVDVVGEATARWLVESGEAPRDNEPPLAEAAAALWLGRSDDAAPGARRTVEAALGPAQPGSGGYERLIREALQRAEVDAGSLAEVISTTVEQTEHACQCAAVARIAPELPVLQLAWTVGDAGAPLGLLGVLAALDEEAPRVILAGGRAASIAVVVA
jgi:hypothetical protein